MEKDNTEPDRGITETLHSINKLMEGLHSNSQHRIALAVVALYGQLVKIEVSEYR